jgi:putative FmdB family regulatory protein
MPGGRVIGVQDAWWFDSTYSTQVKGEQMPTYQFTCTDCGDIILQSFSFDADMTVNCGHCGSIMRKEFTPPAIHFKGDGWGGK